MPCIFLSIPEGVSVMTVIIDGVDVAPAGLVKRFIPVESRRLALEHSAITADRWSREDPPLEKSQLGSPLRTEPKLLFQEAKTAAKAWTRASRHSRTNRPAETCESLRPRNPSLLFIYPGNGITVFTPGEAMPDAH